MQDRPCSQCEISGDCLGPAMAASTGVELGTGQKPGEGRLSWSVLLLTLAAVTSSSLSALSLYQLLALRAEVAGLKADICHRTGERQEARHGGQTLEQMSSGRGGSEPADRPESKPRKTREIQTLVSQPCLQMMPNSSRKTFGKDYDSRPHTAIPWQAGLRRGSALEVQGDSMLVKEDGFYFVYGQVFYKDREFIMGHLVIRWKRNVVGDEPPNVVLFRCIQNMNPEYPFNTCYTGGIVKLEVGDHLELLVGRPAANVALVGESTFLGAVKLA